MFRLTLFVAAVALPLAAGLAQAASKAKPCEPQPVKNCEIRKHPNCGPISLKFWKEDGEVKCDRATVQLTATQVIPELRRLKCFLYGETSDVHFSARNYRTIDGPHNGDMIRMEEGQAHVTIHGHYDSFNRTSHIVFENHGPGQNVLLKCQGFGPA